MKVLESGLYTGKIVDRLNKNGIYINTVHYSLDGDFTGSHYHLNPHICFLLQGADKEKRRNQVYQRKGGDIFFYYSGEEHETVQVNRFMKSMVIELDISFLKKYDLAESQLELALEKNNHLKFTMLKTLKEFQNPDNSNAILSIQMLVLNLYSLSVSKKKAPEWLLKVEELLQDKWNETITLDDLATVANIHPVTISKYFAKFHKETLSEYIRKIKVEHSLSLIKNSNQSLTEVAHYCGFADQSHFIRCFKNATGYLPKDFRKL